MINRKNILFVIIIVLLLMCIVLFYYNATNDNHIIGFAFDAENNLYLGKSGKIEVYEDNEIVRTITNVTNRGYTFTIKNNEILTYTGIYLYHLDLNGNIIFTEDVRNSTSKEYKDFGKSFQNTDGEVYHLKRGLSRTKILKNNDVIVYQEPLSTYLLRSSQFILFFFTFSIGILLFADQIEKEIKF